MPNVVSLAERFPTGRQIMQAPANHWSRYRFEGITPDRLSSVIKKAERGDLEEWADLAAYMLRTDPHLRSVYETRMLAVIAAQISIEPRRTSEPKQALAEKAAEYCRDLVDNFRDWESLVSGLAHAEGVGYAAGQHAWSRVLNDSGQGEWRSCPTTIAPRDIQFSPSWDLRLRTWDERGGQRWVDESRLPPNTLIKHVPHKLDAPTVSGDLMAVAWPWLFKRWARIFQQTGMERLANGFIVGIVPPNSPPAVRQKLLDNLIELSANQVAVVEDGTRIEIKEAAKDVGRVWEDAIASLNDEITKGLVGSLDIVDAEAGSYARADVQFGATVMPRLMAISKRIAGTIERDWFGPALKLNSHLWGAIPPVPTMKFVLEQEEPPMVDQLVVDVGAVTKDEVRRSKGLPEWGPEKGGDLIAKPVAKGPLEGFASASEARAPSPLSRTPSRLTRMMATTTRRRTSPISGASRMRLAGMPFDP